LPKQGAFPFLIVLLISGAVFFLLLGIRSTGYLENLEFIAYDWYIRMQPDVPLSPAPIVIISVTEDDIRRLERWPISDQTMAKALYALIRDGALVVGLDIYRDIKVPPGSETLDSVIKKNKNIITVMKFGDNGVPAPTVTRGTTQVGFNDILVDPGGIVRRGLLFLDDGKEVYYSFSLRLALHFLQVQGIVPKPSLLNPQFLTLGGTTIIPFEPNDGGYVRADSRGYQFLIDYKSKLEKFSSFSLMRLLSGHIPADKIRDKIIIIGVFAESVKDFFYTPYSRGFNVHQQVPGVVIHANLVSQFLRFALEGRSPKNSLSETNEMLWILTWSILGGMIGWLIRSTWKLLIIGSINLFLLCLSTYIALLYNWWIPFVPSALTWMLSAFIMTTYMSNREKNQRFVLMQLFSRYVSPEVAANIWSHRKEFLNEGRPNPQKMPVTVMFTDLRGFTSISEKLEPIVLVEWLNTYMESMTQVVMDHGGVVDDYAGDGIKINFGVPLPRSTQGEINQDAVNAVKCGLTMKKELIKLNKLWEKRNQPMAGMRIGIFTGQVIAAAIGSTKRLKYTTIGDTVNIAARLESYDKKFEAENLCRILIGETTLKCLEGQFKTKPLGSISLKGKHLNLRIFCILGE